MLRKEVLTKWDSFKTKLATVRLTPKDKTVWKFLRTSKTTNFSYHSVDRNQLDDLEKKIKAENEEYNKLDFEGENDLLSDWWIEWMFFNSTILNWIEVKKSDNNWYTWYKDTEEEKERLEKQLEDEDEKWRAIVLKRSKRTRKFIWQFEKTLEEIKDKDFEQKKLSIYFLVTNMMDWFDYERDILGVADEESYLDRI